MNRRIFYGVIFTWTLLEGSRSLFKQWGRMHGADAGLIGNIARDVTEVAC